MNYVRTALLLAALTALFMGVGFMIGGRAGMTIAFVVALAMNLFSYWNADRIALATYGAREVSEAETPELVRMVRDLSARAGLPMPRVYLIDGDQPNAFATGRDPEHAAVAATTGLVAMLTREELAGVMAHELAHIKNRDTLIMTVTATIAGAISMLANVAFFFGGNRENNNPLGWVGVLVAAIVAPLAASIVQMAVSRTREYAADRMGAEICGRPMWLASALAKISGAAHAIPNEAAEAHPASAHLFIVNPLSGRSFDNLFSTHPSTENRIAALQAMTHDSNGTGPHGTGNGGFGYGPGPNSRMPSATGRRGAVPVIEPGRPRGPWN